MKYLRFLIPLYLNKEQKIKEKQTIKLIPLIRFNFSTEIGGIVREANEQTNSVIQKS